jgi:hypothetical protein
MDASDTLPVGVLYYRNGLLLFWSYREGHPLGTGIENDQNYWVVSSAPAVIDIDHLWKHVAGLDSFRLAAFALLYRQFTGQDT